MRAHPTTSRARHATRLLLMVLLLLEWVEFTRRLVCVCVLYSRAHRCYVAHVGRHNTQRSHTHHTTLLHPATQNLAAATPHALARAHAKRKTYATRRQAVLPPNNSPGARARSQRQHTAPHTDTFIFIYVRVLFSYFLHVPPRAHPSPCVLFARCRIYFFGELCRSTCVCVMFLCGCVWRVFVGRGWELERSTTTAMYDVRSRTVGEMRCARAYDG